MTDLYSVVLHAQDHGCAFSISEAELDNNFDAMEAQSELDALQMEITW